MIASASYRAFLFNAKTCGLFCFQVASFVVTAKKTTEYLQDRFQSRYEAYARNQTNFSYQTIQNIGGYYYYGPKYYGELAIEHYGKEGRNNGLVWGILGNYFLGYFIILLDIFKAINASEDPKFDFKANAWGFGAAAATAICCRFARAPVVPALAAITAVGSLVSGGIAAYRTRR